MRRLVVTAPTLPGWRVVAFKPAAGFGFETHYGSVALDPSACWFLALGHEAEPGLFGLRVACPGYDPDLEDEFYWAARIMLQTGLGELSAARQIHHLEVGPLPTYPEADGYLELTRIEHYLAADRTQGQMSSNH